MPPRQRAKRPPAVCATTAHLKSVSEASGRSDGSRRLCVGLNRQGIRIGRYRVRSLMRAYQLKPVWKRKFAHATDSKHHLPVFDNVLGRQFTPAKANQAWAADITYIRTRRGRLYLAAVPGLYSGKIVGWAMAPNMPAGLVRPALQRALCRPRPDCPFWPGRPIRQPGLPGFAGPPQAARQHEP